MNVANGSSLSPLSSSTGPVGSRDKACILVPPLLPPCERFWPGLPAGEREGAAWRGLNRPPLPVAPPTARGPAGALNRLPSKTTVWSRPPGAAATGGSCAEPLPQLIPVSAKLGEVTSAPKCTIRRCALCQRAGLYARLGPR